MEFTLYADPGTLVKELAIKPDDELLDSALVIADNSGRDAATPYAAVVVGSLRKTMPGRRLAQLFATDDNGLRPDTDDKALAVWLDGQIGKAMQQAKDILIARLEIANAKNIDVKADLAKCSFYVHCTSINSRRDLEDILTARGRLAFCRGYGSSYIVPILTRINDSLSGNVKPDTFFASEDMDTGHLFIEGKLIKEDEVPVPNKDTVLFKVLSVYTEYDKRPKEDPLTGVLLTRQHRTVDSLLQSPVAKSFLPSLVRFYFSLPDHHDSVEFIYTAAIPFDGVPPITDLDIIDARSKKDKTTNLPAIFLTMTDAAKSKWARMTRENIDKYIIIVLDDRMYSCARVGSEIKDGAVEISGDYTLQQTNAMAAVLGGGRLPFAISVVNKNK